MFAVRFNNVFSPFRPTYDKSPIVRLNKHIPRPGLLDIIYNFRDRSSLSKSKARMIASCNSRSSIIADVIRRHLV